MSILYIQSLWYPSLKLQWLTYWSIAIMNTQTVVTYTTHSTAQAPNTHHPFQKKDPDIRVLAVLWHVRKFYFMFNREVSLPAPLWRCTDTLTQACRIRTNTHIKQHTCRNWITHSPQCISVLIRSFWQGLGDFSNHLGWGGRKIRSAGEGWAASKLIILSQTYIIISQVSPIRECWCGISAQISHSHRFQYREKKHNREEPRDRISRIPQKSFTNEASQNSGGRFDSPSPHFSLSELWRFHVKSPRFSLLAT